MSHNSLSRYRFTLGMLLPLVGGLSLAVLCTGLCRRWRQHVYSGKFLDGYQPTHSAKAR